MKGFIKVMIAGAVILGLGIAVLIIVLGANGWHIEGDYEMKTYECQETNTALDVDFDAGSLKIEYYEGETIKVEYPENKRITMTATEADGKLTLKSTYKRWINFDWFSIIPETKIWLPQDDVIALNLDVDAGMVSVPEGEYADMNIVMDAGSLHTGALKCKNFSLKMNAGAADVESVISENPIFCKMNAGDFKVKSLECPALKCEISAGSLEAEKVAANELDVDVSAGDARVTMVGTESEYTVDVHKSAGSCNISNRTGTTDKRITAKISAGSVDVRFTN